MVVRRGDEEGSGIGTRGSALCSNAGKARMSLAGAAGPEGHAPGHMDQGDMRGPLLREDVSKPDAA